MSKNTNLGLIELIHYNLFDAESIVPTQTLSARNNSEAPNHKLVVNIITSDNRLDLKLGLLTIVDCFHRGLVSGQGKSIKSSARSLTLPLFMYNNSTLACDFSLMKVLHCEIVC